VLLGHLHAAMSEQYGDLIDGNAGQQQFHRKGVAEHMRVATFARAVRISDVGCAKELAKAALVTLHRTLQITVAAPEKALGAQRRQAFQQGSDCRRQRHEHRHPGLRPPQKKNSMLVQAIDGKTTPAHQ
jgi:hypothetical protein